MVNDTFIFNSENNQPTETINNNILTNYYLINHEKDFYENCVQKRNGKSVRKRTVRAYSALFPALGRGVSLFLVRKPQKIIGAGVVEVCQLD